jgi:predicted transposase/invertase (TIGR01784 family)
MYMVYLDQKKFCFKKFFRDHSHLLKSFLNSMLPFDKSRHMESFEYFSFEMVSENPLLKRSTIDVCFRYTHKQQFILEMQMHWTTTFMQRVLVNASKACVRQVDYSHNLNKHEPVYSRNPG